MASRPSPAVRAILICLILIGLGVLLGGVYLAQKMAASRQGKPVAEKAAPVLLPPVDERRNRPDAFQILPEPAAPSPSAESKPTPEPVEVNFANGPAETSAFPRFEDHLPNMELVVGEQVTAADFNGDRRLDVLTISASGDRSLRLYLNRGDGGFEEISPKSEVLKTLPKSRKFYPADFDNDGDLDLFVLGEIGDGSRLLENNGEGIFQDPASKPTFQGAAQAEASWVDLDRDGWIDLCVTGFREESGSAPVHRLFRNLGNGTFVDLGWETGFLESFGEPGSHLWEDLDADGYPDFVSYPITSPNASEPIALPAFRAIPAWQASGWRFFGFDNREQTARFDRCLALGSADFDNDGSRDLVFVTANSDESGWVFQNRGLGVFNRVTDFSDLDNDDGSGSSRVTCLEIADLNLDGYEDLILGTAADENNRVFLNDGGDAFREVTLAGGFGILQRTTALAAADLDSDGDPDLLASVEGTSGALLDNPGIEDHGWLALDLEGVTANRSAIGARVSLVVRDRDYILHRIERVARGPRVELGLGRAMRIESLEVEWPVVGWPVSRFTEIPMNRLLHIREGDATFEVIDRKPFKLGGGERAAEDETES